MRMFESSVKQDGSQADRRNDICPTAFESSVKQDGSQATRRSIMPLPPFESSVKQDGSQANPTVRTCRRGLRVV